MLRSSRESSLVAESPQGTGLGTGRDEMVGPGKAIDTDKYFVVCSNILGGCKGSSGPKSIDPKTDKPYGLSFPLVSIQDMVNAQKKNPLRWVKHVKQLPENHTVYLNPSADTRIRIKASINWCINIFNLVGHA